MRSIAELEDRLAALEQRNAALEQRNRILEQTTASLDDDAGAEELQRNTLVRRVFEGALDAMILADDEGRYVEVNPAACELFGMPRTELLGSTIARFSAPEYDGAAAYAEFLERGHMRGRFPLVRPDGSRRTLDFNAVANVAPGLNLSVLRDVTDLLAAESALRRSEARFRAMIEKSAEAVLLTAVDRTTLYVSPSSTRLLGWTPEELTGHNVFDWVVPEDRERVLNDFERIVRDKVPEHVVEMRVRRPDGSQRWIEVVATNLIEDPDVGAIVGNIRDVTLRRQFELAMRESEERYRQLIEHLPEPVIVHVAGTIAYANPASARIAGLDSPAELIGRAMSEFATDATRVQMESRVQVLEKHGELGLAEQTFVRPARSSRPSPSRSPTNVGRAHVAPGQLPV